MKLITKSLELKKVMNTLYGVFGGHMVLAMAVLVSMM